MSSRMSERDIGREILESIREIKAHKAGEINLRTRELKEDYPIWTPYAAFDAAATLLDALKEEHVTYAG